MLPTPIFERGDFYEAGLWFAALCLIGLLFPPSAFSNDRKTVSRWRFFSVMAVLGFLIAITTVVGSALHRGAEAAGSTYVLAWEVVGGLTPPFVALAYYRLWLAASTNGKTGEL